MIRDFYQAPSAPGTNRTPELRADMRGQPVGNVVIVSGWYERPYGVAARSSVQPRSRPS